MPEIPIGSEFLELIFGLQDKCEAATQKRLPDLGKSAPECYQNLGTALSYLDRMASCFWGCRAGDHVIERVIGRVASTAEASLRLVLFGHYDESLGLTRSIGESSNLLFLFVKEASAYSEWLAASEQERKRKFSAVKVRIKLEGMGIPKEPFEFFVIGEERYSALSEVAVHLTPETTPQTYNFAGVPILGAHYQEVGFLSCLNELCRAVGLALLYAPWLLAYATDRKKGQNAAITLLASMGRIDMLTDWSILFKEGKPSQPPSE